MSLVEKIDQISKEKAILNEKILNLKTEYKQYITNKDIPLMVRWDFYLEAPVELKEQNRWLIRPQTKFLQYVKENWFDAPECYGRGKQIYIDELFQDIVYEGKIYLENLYEQDITQEDVENGLEELLQMNLEYFTFDW